jgi:predicted esterase YcpF (UPF0227 family)
MPDPVPADGCDRLIYLHGFRSSPRSIKAQMFARRMAQAGRATDFVCPALPDSPAAAIAMILDSIRPTPRDVVVGSSLGGFYARYVAEQCDPRTVLLNPSVRPAESLARHLGRGTRFHSDEPFEFVAEHLNELRAFEVPRVSRPERCLLIAATGDELLDWRDMVAAWEGARTLVIEGSDHALSDFDLHIDHVLAFAGIGPAGSAQVAQPLTGEPLT